MIPVCLVLLAAGLLLSALLTRPQSNPTYTDEPEEFAFEAYLRTRFPGFYEE